MNIISKTREFDENVKRIKNTLRSTELLTIIKQHFVGQYTTNEINAAFAEIEIIIKEHASSKPIISPRRITPEPRHPSKNETIQNWVKRIFRHLLSKKILSERELALLHNKEYSRQTFGIAYPMIVDRQHDTIIVGHARYWQSRIEGFYICSQWWKQDDHNYEVSIRKWLKSVYPNYVEHGLDRS